MAHESFLAPFWGSFCPLYKRLFPLLARNWPNKIRDDVFEKAIDTPNPITEIVVDPIETI